MANGGSDGPNGVQVPGDGEPRCGTCGAYGHEREPWRCTAGHTMPGFCGRCRRPQPADAQRCASCQSWLPQNQAARKEGLYAKHQPLAVLMSADDLLNGLLEDKGGADEMSTLKRSLAAKLRDTDVLLELNKRTIVREGVETPTGRKAHDRYLAALDRFVRVAAMLGLERAARRVPSLAEVMRDE